MFVAGFPLAPFFALLNNVLEIRVDAVNYICNARYEFVDYFLARSIAGTYPRDCKFVSAFEELTSHIIYYYM